MAGVCDCEHGDHDPAGVRTATGHQCGEAKGMIALKSPWGATFWLCQACVDAGHMQGTQFR